MSAQTVTHHHELQDHLSAGKRALIAAMASETRAFSPKTPIPLRGEDQTMLYRVVSGWAVGRRILSDGRSQIASVFVPGDIIGAQALLRKPSIDVLEPRALMTMQSIGY